MRIRSSLLANLVGQGWTAVLNLVAVPFYIRFLGIDAFGVIGLYTVVLTVASLLDAGMTTTLNREMVRYIAGERTQAATRDLVRSVEIVLGVVSLVTILAAWPLGAFLSAVWIAQSSVPTEALTFSFAMMIIASVLRIAEAIYRAALLGLHRPVLMNALSVISTGVRIIGVFGVLSLAGADLYTFFAWQVTVAIGTLGGFAIATHGAIGRDSGHRPRFSTTELRGVRDFAGGAFAVAALGVALTQLDKIVVPRLVSLREVGYYAAAVAITVGVYQIVLPIFHSFYPRLSYLNAQGEDDQFAATYLLAAKLLAVVVGPPVAILVLFSGDVLFAWTADPDVSVAAAPLLQLLAPGALAYGLYHLPLAALLAVGAQRAAVRAAIIGIAVLIPALLVGFEIAGIGGLAFAWSATMVLTLGLNLVWTKQAAVGTASLGRIAGASLLPVLIAFCLAGLATLPPVHPSDRIAIAAKVIVIGIIVLAVTAACAWNGALAARLRRRTAA